MKLLPQKLIAKKKSTVRPEQKVSTLAILVRKALVAGVTSKAITDALRSLRTDKLAVAHISKRRGRAKGRGQSSKAKGRSAVVLVRDLLQRTYGLGDDDLLVKATSMGGCDLHLSPYAQSFFPFAIEAKNVEALSIWNALAQAQVNADKKNQPPVVFFKRAHSPLYVAFKAEDILKHLTPKNRV